MAKNKLKKKIDFINSLDESIKIIEEEFVNKFVRKVKGWINKIINNDNDIYSINKNDIDTLYIIIRNYYKSLGLIAIEKTNNEIESSYSKKFKQSKDNDLIDLSDFARKKAIEKVKAFQKLLKNKLNKLIEGTNEIISRTIKDSINLFKARHIESMAYTDSINIISNQRLKSFERSNVIQGVLFHATLDSRTTHICRPRHDMTLRLDNPLLPKFSPALHYYCRSYLIPIYVNENFLFTSDSDLRSVPDPIFTDN